MASSTNSWAFELTLLPIALDGRDRGWRCAPRSGRRSPPGDCSEAALRLVDREPAPAQDHQQAADHRDEAQGPFDHTHRLRPLMDATQRLVDELRTHALVIGEVVLTSGATAQYYVDAKRAILRPRRIHRFGRDCGLSGERVGRDRGRRPHHGRRPRRLRRAGRRLRRQGLLCPQGDKAARSAAAHRGADPRRRRPLRDRRGRRHHRRLDPAGDRSRARGRATTIVGVIAVLDRLAGGAEKIEAAAGAPFVACATIDQVYPDRPDRG